MFFIVDGSPLLGHGVSLVCPGQSPFVFFSLDKGEETRPERKNRKENILFAKCTNSSYNSTTTKQNKTT